MKYSVTDWFDLILDILKIDDEPDVLIKKGNNFFDIDFINDEYFSQHLDDNTLSKKGVTLFEEGYSNPLIYINLDLHNEDEIYITIAHELRHLYQVNQSQLNSAEAIEWNINLNNYYSSEVNDYQKQPLEVDANAFTKWVCKKYLNRVVLVHDTDDNLFEKYFNIISNKYDINNKLKLDKLN